MPGKRKICAISAWTAEMHFNAGFEWNRTQSHGNTVWCTQMSDVKGDIDLDFIIIFSRLQYQCRLYLICDQMSSVTILMHLIPFTYPRFFFFLNLDLNTC